jgi:hypothetical protein
VGFKTREEFYFNWRDAQETYELMNLSIFFVFIYFLAQMKELVNIQITNGRVLGLHNLGSKGPKRGGGKQWK